MLNESVAIELLFYYGTLRRAEVRLATFGHAFVGQPDAIVGFELDWPTTAGHRSAAIRPTGVGLRVRPRQ